MTIETENYIDILITLPRRGLRIIPPGETAANMVRVKEGQSIVPWTAREKARLALIKNDTIMRKRFPNPNDGQALMEDVCYQRREELLSLAVDLSNRIVEEWDTMTPNKNIAIILFGSVARGLVRRSDHYDPSNLDMSVIGDFTEEERTELLDAIRPARKETGQKILETCGEANVIREGSGNAGVYVQHVDKLINNKFATAKEYISSNAMVLHDPVGIWSAIEGAALDHEVEIMAQKAEKAALRYRPQGEKVIFVSF